MASVLTNRWILNRRHALKGIGATIALPLLDCMVPRKASPLPKPRRCVFVYIPNGVNVLTWQISKSGKDYEFPASMQPLARHREAITPISGLHHPNGMGQAHECDKIWLTGAELRSDGGAFRNTVSADQLMAEVEGIHTRYASLELSTKGGSLAWSREGVLVPSERKPSVVFQRLFGISDKGKEAKRQDLRRRGSVLDTVVESARRLKASVGREDQTKLDDYLSAVRDVEGRLERADAWLDVPKPVVDTETRARLDRDIPYSDAGDYYRTMYDLILLTLRTDQARVITWMSDIEGQGLPLPEIGVNQGRHELTHHNDNPDLMTRLTRCDAFLTEHFATFLDGLGTVSESEEVLLDRTMVLFGSGMAYGHSHGNSNLPIVLAGGGGLGVRHGRHVDFNRPKNGSHDLGDRKNLYRMCLRPTDPNARLSNLLLTMLERMGVEARTFGDSTGVVSELT